MWDAIAGIYLISAIITATLASWRLVRALAAAKRFRSDLALRILATAVLMGCALALVVESASLVRQVSAFGLGTAWWAMAALGTIISSRWSARSAKEADGVVSRVLQPASSPEQRILYFVSGLIVLVSFLLAILTPPTSWDSLTYHLPRVLNWIQNSSVAHFATHDTRQVESGPLAAFAVMQLYLVTDSDRLVNLVQWGAMILSVLGAGWLAAQLAGFEPSSDKNEGSSASERNPLAWTILFAVTMPVGIVQSITTQTDYVIAFWVISTAVFGVCFWKERADPVYAFFLAASIGLGIVTKATMVITAGLLALGILLIGLRAAVSNPVRVRALAVMVITGSLIVAPHFIRNFKVFGSPLGSQYIYALMRNERQTPGIWVSNFVRNLSLHAATGIPSLTTGVNAFLKSAHTLSGRGDNERDSTFYTSTFSYINGYPISDNSAGNFWHGVIALLGAAFLFVRYRSLRKPILAITAIVLATFVIQSGYLRWTEWNARFHLSLFLVIAPIAGLALTRFPAPARVVCALILSVVGLHATFFNKSRPLLGESEFLFYERERQYFTEVPYIYRPALNAVTDVIASRSEAVGLRMYKNFFNYQDEMEYPFWVMLRKRGFNGKIYNIGVTNETARLSNSVPIHALISSMKGPKDEVAHLLPYSLSYPPLDVYWDESHSGWIQLAQMDSDGIDRPLLENPNALELAANTAILSCRAARQGILTLDAAIVQNEAMVAQPTALLARSFAGFTSISRSSNGRHHLEIPLPPGSTAVEFGIPGGASDFRSLPLQWSWKPTDQPLPYVFVSRIYNPAVRHGAATNALTILPGENRILQLVAGASGDVDLHFFSATNHVFQLTMEANNKLLPVVSTNGTAVLRLTVHQGTNSFTISNTSGESAVVERIDPNFRAAASE